MDVESAKDLSVGDGKLVVFTELGYSVRNGNRISRFIKKTSTNLNNGQVILNGASGAIRPGRLTFILGPSGAGKTTLMNILAGRKKTGVTGELYGAGKKAVLVAQHATLIDTLTARETLQFAARLKLPSASGRERLHAIESVSTQLGILDVLNTRTNRLSGGERKRLTIACELLTDPYIMLLDEPTSGLDSVSSMSVVQALRTVAHTGRTVACVIHQPSSKLYASADDIILVSNGKTLYSGALTDIPEALSRAGFICPPFYNMADYLLEIASGEHSGNLSVLDNEIKNYAYEMRAVVKNEVFDDREKGTEAEALLNSVQPLSKGYPASFCQQLGALLWRSSIGVLRDVYLTQIRMACHIIVALLLGALYTGAGAEAGRVLSNTSCLFFFILFLFFSNAMPTVQTFPIEKKVVLQEHLNKWYSLHAYCLAKILIDIPFQLLCATVFIIPVWYITSQPMDFFRFGLMWFLCALLTVLAQSFGLAMGAAVGVKMGLFLVPATNIPMLMFSEFFIPYREMPLYLRPFASISYFKYALDAAVSSVYGFGRPKLPCNQIYCMFKDPKYLIEHLGLTCNFVADTAVIVVWIVLLQIIFMILLKYKAYSACR